ncbi:MAG: hypothetical protein V4506_09290 [Bacteroidota bacterium]
MKTNYFLNMIQHLRQYEEVMLYGHVLIMNDADCKEVIEFLKNEYQTEITEYPYHAPPFNDDAALWAAKTIYLAAQLLLYRENKPEDLDALFPEHIMTTDASAILSADLCLRFLPDAINELKIIDSMDPLIPLLENILLQWHFSGINYPLETEKLNQEITGTNDCLKQLYINRIIEYKKIHLARHPVFKEWISANMGIFTQEFWNEFQLEKNTDG